MPSPDPSLTKLRNRLGLNRSSQIPLRAFSARFALIYLTGMIALSGILLGSINLNARDHLKTRIERERDRIEIAKLQLAHDFSVINSELRLYAGLSLMKRYLDNGSMTLREELAQNFLALARTTQHYDQVRYLNTAGREIIRINFNNGQPFIVAPAQLQDKSGRYYFRDTIRLGPGQIFISPLDLNIEHDQLEIPYKPMIRFGMPLFDSAGNRRGILMFNYFGNELLHNFREAMSGGDPHHSMLLNRDGYWLSSNRSEDEWGFMLNKTDRTFGHDYAEEWRTISSQEQGVLQTRNGLFAYATFYPLHAGQYSSSGTALPQAPSEREFGKYDYAWKIVSYVPPEVLSGDFYYNQPGGKILFLLLYTLFAPISAGVAYISLSRKQALAEVRENERRLREITGTLSEGLLVINRDGLITFVNPEACTTLGYTEQELLGQDMHERLHVSHDSDAVLSRDACNILWAMHSGANYRAAEETFRCKDGSLLPVAVSASAIAGATGSSGMVVAFHDISERKRAERELRRAAEEIEDLYDHAPCGYHSLNPDGVVVRINHTELEWLGYRREEVVGKMHFSNLLTPASLQTFRENFPIFKETGYIHNLEFEVMRKDGSTLPVLASATAIRDDTGKIVMSRSTLFDLTERKKLERMLEQQARTDVLTGLANRRHFFDLAELELMRARRHSKSLAVLLIDLDHFKAVNDNYGHHAGDLVLKKFSEVCVQTIREIDFAGRLGGEEFAVLLTHTSATEAYEVAERLRLAAADAAVPLDQGEILHFTVSIGIAGRTETDQGIGTILRRADLAMYQAKKNGRNLVCLADEMTQKPTGHS